ncbi:MAG: replicative DNA helicase [Bacteroidetes bacterium GWE2_29_8]|nr:MAG: replicative DNA helicase [Bacteroidetes bacterium GWE2_29_8]
MADTYAKVKAQTKKQNNLELLSGMGKLPPQAIDLEEAVLGALMLEKEAIISVIEFLKAECFYKEANSDIYGVIRELFANNEPIDILTVTQSLKTKGLLEKVGGAYYITTLTNRVASAANIEFHSRIIMEKYIQRELIRISSMIIKESYEDSTDVFELLDRAESELFEVSESNLHKTNDSMSDLIKDALEQITKAANSEETCVGVPSGFTEVDRATSGWRNSDFIIIAARPGMGKTAFVLSMVRNIAIEHNRPLAIFSLEMASIQLVMRLIAIESEISVSNLQKGNLTQAEWQHITNKVSSLGNAPIYIDDTPAQSIFDIRAKCRRLKSQKDIQIIIIDYLQLMSGNENSRGNREQEIASISRALKGLAKELNVPVIALAQLSRAVETRSDKSRRPVLSDLRESGSIEQDADMVLFINRPEYYGIEEDHEGASTKGLAELIIAKYRNGKQCDIKLRFIDHLTKFTDYDGFDNYSLPDSTNDFSGSSQFDQPKAQTFPSKINNDDSAPF